MSTNKTIVVVFFVAGVLMTIFIIANREPDQLDGVPMRVVCEYNDELKEHIDRAYRYYDDDMERWPEIDKLIDSYYDVTYSKFHERFNRNLFEIEILFGQHYLKFGDPC